MIIFAPIAGLVFYLIILHAIPDGVGRFLFFALPVIGWLVSYLVLIFRRGLKG